MYPSKELVDQLFLEKVHRARATDPAEKLLDGARLFDLTCRIAMDGIRDRNPNATEEEVRRLLFEQVDRVRRLEQIQ